MNSFLYPEWQIPMETALLETDKLQLIAKLRAAQVKISERLQEIGHSSGGGNEKDAMIRALIVITAITRDSFEG